jgi:ABC-type sugar transport system substrate-binding protein
MIETYQMRTNPRVWGVLLAVLMVLVAAASPDAFPLQEVEPEGDRPAVGTVYTSLSTGYYFEGLYYQCLDQAMQRSLNELAKSAGYGLLEIDVGTRPYEIRQATRTLIDRGAEGIVLCLQQPAGALQGVEVAHEAGIPVVVSGITPAAEIGAPFVSVDISATGKALGEQTAKLFKEHFPEETAHLMIANTRAIPANQQMEEAFIHGFTRLIPDRQIITVPDDNGSVLNTQELVRLQLLEHPEANVFFGTSDMRTEGILLALEQNGRGSLETEILAGTGGTAEAMKRLLEPGGPWKVEAGYSVSGLADAALRMLSDLIAGDLPMGNGQQVLVESVILREPTLEEVKAYLREHQRFEDFEPK